MSSLNFMMIIILKFSQWHYYKIIFESNIVWGWCITAFLRQRAKQRFSLSIGFSTLCDPDRRATLPQTVPNFISLYYNIIIIKHHWRIIWVGVWFFVCSGRRHMTAVTMKININWNCWGLFSPCREDIIVFVSTNYLYIFHGIYGCTLVLWPFALF